MNPNTAAGPERFVAENQEAEAHLGENRIAAAARILVSIVEQDNQNWRAYNNMGILSWMQKYWEDAYTMFERALFYKPDFSDALVNLFDAALKLKRIDRAIPFFKKAVETNPALEEAKIIYEACIDTHNDIYQSQRALMVGTYNPLIEEGEKLLSEGLTIKAAEKFLQSNDTQGPNAEAFCGLGVIAYYQKNYNDAYMLFLNSIKLNPLKTDTFLNLLDAAKNCDKTAEAQRIYAEFAATIPALSELAEYFNNPAIQTPSGS